MVGNTSPGRCRAEGKQCKFSRSGDATDEKLTDRVVASTGCHQQRAENAHRATSLARVTAGRRPTSPLKNRVRPCRVVTQRKRRITFDGWLLTERYRVLVHRRTSGMRAINVRACRRRPALPGHRIQPYILDVMNAICGPRSAGFGGISSRVGAATHLALARRTH